jgi:hypothetical protein
MDTTDAQLDDLLTRVEADLKAAQFFGDRAAATIPSFAAWADTIKQYRPDWITADDSDAQLVRRIEAICEPRPRSRLLSAKEAADRLGMLSPDGQPSDRFYADLAPKLGTQVGRKWTFPETVVEAFAEGRS